MRLSRYDFKESKTGKNIGDRPQPLDPEPGRALRFCEKEGIGVTQATLSRDIRELGLVKVRGSYQVSGEVLSTPSDEVLRRAFEQFVIRTGVSDNIVMIKTSPGNAHSVGVVLDAAQWPEVLGTVAGDDTVFVFAQKQHGQKRSGKNSGAFGMKIRVGVVGVSGYAGLELIKLILASRDGICSGHGCGGDRRKAVVGHASSPAWNQQPDHFSPGTGPDRDLQLDTVFLCTPDKVSYDLVPKILSLGFVSSILAAHFV